MSGALSELSGSLSVETQVMKCPNCGLMNPDSAMRCDCGYDFVSQQIEESFLAPNSKEIKLEPEMVRAKNKLFSLFVIFIVMEGFVIFLSSDVKGIVRIIFSILLMYFVISGYMWAKWAMIIIFYLGASLILITGYESLTTSLPLTILMITYAALHAAIATFLGASKPLNKYFSYNKKRPTNWRC